MTPAALIAFGVCFVLGPTICALVLRLPARPGVMLALAAIVLLATLSALKLQANGAVFPSLGLIWFGWVVGIALAALAVRRRITAPRLRRWVTVGALLTTTLPWFGLATAEMMV